MKITWKLCIVWKLSIEAGNEAFDLATFGTLPRGAFDTWQVNMWTVNLAVRKERETIFFSVF